MQNEMRQWIVLVETVLAEGKVAYRSSDYVVIENPSKQEYARMAVKADHGEGLRAILDEYGSLYVWDGYYANHNEIARELALYSVAHLHLWPDHVDLDGDMIDFGDDPDEEDTSHLEDVANQIRTNPSIRRIYGPHVTIEAEVDYGKRSV